MQMLYVNTALSLCLSPMLPQMIMYALSHRFHFCPPSPISIFSSPRENRRLASHFGVGSLQAAEVRKSCSEVDNLPQLFACHVCVFPFRRVSELSCCTFVSMGRLASSFLTSWLLCSHSNLILGSWRWPSLEVFEVR